MSAIRSRVRNNTVAKLLAVTDARMDSQQQPAGREGIGGGVLAAIAARRCEPYRRPGEEGAEMRSMRRGEGSSRRQTPSPAATNAAIAGFPPSALPASERVHAQQDGMGDRVRDDETQSDPNMNLPSPSR